MPLYPDIPMKMAAPIIWLCLLLLGGFVGAQTDPVISTESGRVVGKVFSLPSGKAVRQYLGIPFAKAKRFQSPQPPTLWNGVKQAVKFGKICPQFTSPLFPAELLDMSEDCLNLNVYVSNGTNSTSALPVMVYIYGGSYTSGANTFYDGSFIASTGNVIVVVPNYRIGALGFLRTGKNGLTGNYGLLDQIQALEWVKKNIKGFGGGPNKVTIFGESAGGSSVALLMLSPLTKGLFQNVIMQSGSAVAHWVAAYNGEAEATASSVGSLVGCNNSKEMEACLKKKPVVTLVAAGYTVLFSTLARGKPGLAPAVDGHVLPDIPLNLLEQGNFTKVNVIIGVTNGEGLVLTNIINGLTAGVNVTNGVQRSTFLQVSKSFTFARNLIPPVSEAILYRYTDWSNVNDPISNRDMYVNMVGDAMFKAPAVLSADLLAKAGVQTFFYNWEIRLPYYPGTNITLPSWISAYHGADVFILFGFPPAGEMNYTMDAIKRWTNFAKSGNPNGPEKVSVSWPQYTVNAQHYLSIKPAPQVHAKLLRPDHMAFWNTYVPAAIRSMPIPVPSTCGPTVVNGGQVNGNIGHLQYGLAIVVALIAARQVA